MTPSCPLINSIDFVNHAYIYIALEKKLPSPFNILFIDNVADMSLHMIRMSNLCMFFFFLNKRVILWQYNSFATSTKQLRLIAGEENADRSKTHQWT